MICTHRRKSVSACECETQTKNSRKQAGYARLGGVEVRGGVHGMVG